MFSSKPNRAFQADLDRDQARRNRQNHSLSLRRKDRELELQKKRKKILSENGRNAVSHEGSRSSSPNTLSQKRQQQQKWLEELPKYVQGTSSEHRDTIFECTQKIRQLLSHSQMVPIQQVLDSGVLPRILQFLEWNDQPELQFESLWVLTNILSTDNVEWCRAVIAQGAIPLFLNFVSCQNYALLEQAVWTVGNIAGDGISFRDLLVQNGALGMLKEACKQPFNPDWCYTYGDSDTGTTSDAVAEKRVLRTLSWCVSNFCRYPLPDEPSTTLVLECLFHLFNTHQKAIVDDDADVSNPDAIASNLGWSLFYLTKDIDTYADSFVMQVMNKTGITRYLIQMLDMKNIATLHSVLRAVGNLLSSTEDYTSICIECGVLKHLYNLMKFFYVDEKHKSDLKLKELCWALSNITAGTPAHVLAVIEANFIPLLLELLQNCPLAVGTEALWAISNATATLNVNVIRYLVEQGAIQSMCNYFTKRFYHQSYSKSTDKLMFISLECVQNILSADDPQLHRYAVQFETYGGVDFLEWVQAENNVSEGVYNKCVEIMKKHFGADDDSDALLAHPNDVDISCGTNGQQFGFGLGPSADKKINTTNTNNNFQF
mmetsp:Transcript_55329/g.91892  ORF Transcript_55329/g.91892 Transcript_55329/m.91892 type:complete len:601 (-) Transcript_55329:450-2252(-)